MPNARLPRSAGVLATQLGERFKNLKMEKVGDTDGFNVHRKVKFDKTTSKFLDKVLPHLDDPRIVDHQMREGVAYVTFSPRSVADFRDPFALDDAETVADDQK